MTNNNCLRWAKILFGTFSIIASIASSYSAISAYLKTFIENEGLTGVFSFFLVLIFIWGAIQFLFDTWIIDPGWTDFLDNWRDDDSDKSDFR